MTVLAALVSGILPVLPDGRVLLLLRPSGTWDPPAGRLAPGESFEAGAVRELYEETSLLLSPARMLATWVGERPGGGGSLASVIYASRAPRSAENGVRLSDEHTDYRWATIEEWLTLPSWWSREAILSVPGVAHALPEPETPEAPIPQSPDSAEVVANLGAGTVLVDDAGGEPRALLMRRRKPPVGLWENPGGMLEPGEDFVTAAARETLEETGLKAEPRLAWWARVEPWKGPRDRDLYAGIGFLSRHPGAEVRLEEEAHDDYLWATREEWETLRTWYTTRESENLWQAINRVISPGQRPNESL